MNEQTNIIKSKNGILKEWLGGFEEEIFFEEIFEQKYFQFTNSNIHEKIDRIKIFNLLEDNEFKSRSTNSLNIIDSLDKTTANKPRDIPTVEQLVSGTSLQSVVFNGLQKEIVEIAEMCNEIGNYIGACCRANAYYTPKNSKTFKLHFDNHDVFIVQVTGKKSWKVQSGEAELVSMKCIQPTFEEVNTAMDDIEMNVGDILYIPRGQQHCAYTCDTDSLHITFGFTNFEWSDLISTMIDLQTYRKKSYRAGIPLGSRKKAFEEIKNQLKEVIEECSNDLWYEESIKVLQKKLSN